MNKKILPMILAAVLLVGTASFYGGMKYGQSKTPGAFGAGNFPAGMRENSQRFASSTIPGGRNSGNGFGSGEITAKDNESITIKLQDGSTKIIFYSRTTEILKSATGTASDLEIGKNVTVNGTTNQDGSITAKSVQIRTEANGNTPPEILK